MNDAPPGSEEAPTDPIVAARKAKSRQAVILIHGIGEQRPMDTLRSFVDGVLDQSASESLADAKYYSKPDFLSDNLELRRLVSRDGRNGRTDFYELYWAHLMPTAAWDRLTSWFWMLMYRKPVEVPRRLWPVWAMSWLVLTLVLLQGLWTGFHLLFGYPVTFGFPEKLPWLIIALFALLSVTVRSYIGDAAVYLNPNPRNIEARQKIRAASLNLLDRVAKSGRYDRILVVGHSLGSVVGYDMLNFAWQRHVDAYREQLSAEWKGGKFPDVEFRMVRTAEQLTKEIRDNPAPTPDDLFSYAQRWQRATRDVAGEMKSNGNNWLVTDFVTLGSPLTYGDLLLAGDRQNFERRARERELPHCPPLRELSGRFSFKHEDRDNQGRPQHAWILSHASVFAATAWTNLYFPSRLLFKGDIIGGPIAPLFWAGVRDVRVQTKRWGGWLAHTHYWHRDARDRGAPGNPVVTLRDALDLKRSRGSEVGPPQP